MTVQQMRYFIEVINAGSISAAAERLYTAQSTVSAAIAAIEAEYGFSVFTRSSRGTVLTEQGERLAMDVKNILQQIDLLNTKYIHTDEQKILFSVATQHHIPGIDALCRLMHMHGQESSTISFFEMRTSDVLNLVANGKCDVGLLFFSINSKNFMIQKLRTLGLVFHHLDYRDIHIYLRAGHPLADRKMLTYRDLRPYPRIAYDRSIETDTLFTDVMANTQIPRLIHVTDRAAAYAMLEELDAFLIASGYRTKMERDKGIVSIPLQNNDKWEVGYVRHTKTVQNLLLEDFIKLYKEELNKL